MSIEEKRLLDEMLDKIKKIDDDNFLQNAKLDAMFAFLKQLREMNESVDKVLTEKISRIENELRLLDKRVENLELKNAR